MFKPKVRELQVNDVFTLARMLGKITKGARQQIASALSGKGKVDPTEFGMVIFQSVLLEAEEDLKGWLADLLGKSKDEFGTMPATAILDIIEALADKKDIKDFFARASQLANRLTI